MNFLTKILFILLFPFSCLSNENITVRFVDLDYVFKNSKTVIKFSKSFEKKRSAIVAENNKETKKFEKQKDQILSKKEIISEDEFKKLVIEHQKQVQQYQIKMKNKLNDIKTENVKKSNELLNQITQIILDFAKSNKIDLVIKKNDLIVSNSDLDITKQIIKVINK